MSELVYAESAPGAGVVGLITGSGGMGKTALAIRAAHVLRPNFPGGVFFLDLFGMSPQPAAAADALLRPSPPMCQGNWPRSWPTPRSRRVWTR